MQNNQLEQIIESMENVIEQEEKELQQYNNISRDTLRKKHDIAKQCAGISDIDMDDKKKISALFKKLYDLLMYNIATLNAKKHTFDEVIKLVTQSLSTTKPVYSRNGGCAKNSINTIEQEV